MGMVKNERNNGSTAVAETKLAEAPTSGARMSKTEASALINALAATLIPQGEDDRVRKAEIEVGGKLIKPEDMSYSDAIEILRRRQKEEETEISIVEQINAFPMDGAYALSLAIEEQFGVAFQQTQWSFFGPNLPQRHNVRTPKGEIAVPWGLMVLPGLKNTTIETSITRSSDGGFVFQFACATLQKHEKKIRKLVNRARELVVERSLFRGQALKIDFDKMSNPGYAPEFMSTEETDGSVLILNKETEEQFLGSVLTPIERTAVCREQGIPLRRGILLEGPFGTGKTLSARKVARACVKHGWTFLYLTNSLHLPEAKKLARRYGPAVIFSEDLDQILVKDTVAIESVRNALDAVDSKNDETIVLCTTNRLQALKDARGMLRPGRFDSLIHIGYPDAEAVSRLLRHYAGDLLPVDEPLDEVSKMLEKSSAAMIRECVERAKLWSVAHGTEGSLHQADLVSSTKQLKAHIAIMSDEPAPLKSPTQVIQEHLTNGIQTVVKNEVEQQLTPVKSGIQTILNKLRG